MFFGFLFFSFIANSGIFYWFDCILKEKYFTFIHHGIGDIAE